MRNNSDCHHSGASFIGLGGTGKAKEGIVTNKCDAVKGLWHGYWEEPWYEGSGG